MFAALQRVAELLQQLLLAAAQLYRRFQHNAAHEIALFMAAYRLYPFALEPEHGARLRAGRDFDRGFTVERGHFDFRAERGGPLGRP